jgi:hypothetical protein
MAETRNPQPSVGISNRETPREEAEERREHPPAGANARKSGGAPAHESEPSMAEADGQQHSKSGVRSTAQKESATKYAERSMPATSKTDGASGREPDR